VDISSFDDLLCAARAQPEPQRLLFVFADAVLPDDSSPEQRARFEAGQGGALVPLMFVDKTPVGGAVDGRKMGMDDQIPADVPDPEFPQVSEKETVDPRAGLQNADVSGERPP
jgi:hypothetical protein